MTEYSHRLLIIQLNKFIEFMPSLVFGIILIIIGWILSWFIKRMIIQVCILLKIDRTLIKFTWGRALSKSDVRNGLYSFIGTLGFLVTFLIFLYYAMIIWDLKFLSELLREGILLFPKIITAALIFLIGWLITIGSSKAVHKFMSKENIPYAAFIAYYTKIILIVLFSAMALVELNIAREITIIGFTIISVTLGTIAVVLTIILGRKSLLNLKDPSETKDQESQNE